MPLRPTRSTADAAAFFTPASVPHLHRSASFPHLFNDSLPSPPPYKSEEDTVDEDELDRVHLRRRYTHSRPVGETTETEDGVRRLPTARRITSRKQAALNTLFSACRWLAIIPALLGTLYHARSAFRDMERTLVILWAILTGWQCLALTTGLLTRWRAYYPPLATLVRLLALQAICWPATHFTLIIFNHARRPLICWILIATTTCISRSIQLWATSNLWQLTDVNPVVRISRRWNWSEVGLKCALPAGIAYCITAWGLLLQRELT